MKKRNPFQARFSRREKSRPIARRIIIFCDDTKTAPAYFSALRRHLSGEYSAPPIIDPRPAKKCGTTPAQLVKHAEDEAAKLSLASRDDSVWVLIDLEHTTTEPECAHQLRKKQANRPHLRPVVSKPCFEVWTLHHLQDTGEHFSDCGAVNRRLKIAWKRRFGADFGGKKAQADYAKILHLHKKAAECSKRHRRSSHCYSEVYLIIEEINAYLKSAAQ